MCGSLQSHTVEFLRTKFAEMSRGCKAEIFLKLVNIEQKIER